MARYFWTMAEHKIIRELYPTGGAKACRERLPDRTESAIHQQALKLGIGTTKQKRHKKPYPVTPEIDREIIECYRRRTEKGQIARLAHRLNRPYWWVKKRASHLGVAVPLKKEAPWTEAEIELLRKNAHKNPAIIRRTFAKHGFARTETAIVVKRKRLDIWAVDEGHYTATQLAMEFGEDVKKVTGWIDKGLLLAKRRGTERTERQGGDMWWIKRKHVRDFVADNAGVIDLRKVERVWFVDLLVNP